jgi:hypothetical protein
MHRSKFIGIAFFTALAISVFSSGFSQGNTSSNAQIQARKDWRETISRVSLPKKGSCYHAYYPSTRWSEVGCIAAPNRPFAQWLPETGKIQDMISEANGQRQTVGDGVDYVAKVPGLTSIAIGQFSSVSGVISETGAEGANDYSLQLNSNFMNTAVCNGHSGCLAWEQFVYSSGEQALFMQYWLLNYGTCPSGWNTYSTDCWKNSAAVHVPTIPISEIINVDLWGGAGASSDSILLTTGSYDPSAGTDSYSYAAPTSVLDLSTGWSESEFNIFGDGGGSAATFNAGSSLGIQIQLKEQGSVQSAPTCVANAGTTGETNNLSLVGGCTAGILSNSNPAISFIESN